LSITGDAVTPLRFAIAALPAALLSPPRVGARDLVLVGTFRFTGLRAASAVSWGVGNVLVKRLPSTDLPLRLAGTALVLLGLAMIVTAGPPRVTDPAAPSR
jgi:hypothetical protein